MCTRCCVFANAPTTEPRRSLLFAGAALVFLGSSCASSLLSAVSDGAFVYALSKARLGHRRYIGARRSTYGEGRTAQRGVEPAPAQSSNSSVEVAHIFGLRGVKRTRHTGCSSRRAEDPLERGKARPARAPAPTGR